MHERDPVVEAHDLVLDVVRLLGMQLREHRLDQAYVLGDGLGPDLVTDDHAADHATLPLLGWAPPWPAAGRRHSRSMTGRRDAGGSCRTIRGDGHTAEPACERPGQDVAPASYAAPKDLQRRGLHALVERRIVRYAEGMRYPDVAG